MVITHRDCACKYVQTLMIRDGLRASDTTERVGLIYPENPVFCSAGLSCY